MNSIINTIEEQIMQKNQSIRYRDEEIERMQFQTNKERRDVFQLERELAELKTSFNKGQNVGVGSGR